MRGTHQSYVILYGLYIFQKILRVSLQAVQCLNDYLSIQDGLGLVESYLWVRHTLSPFQILVSVASFDVPGLLV